MNRLKIFGLGALCSTHVPRCLKLGKTGLIERKTSYWGCIQVGHTQMKKAEARLPLRYALWLSSHKYFSCIRNYRLGYSPL